MISEIMKQRYPLTIILVSIMLCQLTSFQLQAQRCQPLYPRIFWNPEAEEISPFVLQHIFMFNTQQSCPYSFVIIEVKQTQSKFRCTQKEIQTYNDDKTPQFHAYIQTCRVKITKVDEIGQFTYQLFGTKYIDGGSGMGSDKFDVQMPTSSLPLRLAVISDWGPIIDRPYKPLNDTLDYILQMRQNQRKSGEGTSDWRINGLLLNGDYAYQLQSEHCQRYVMFLNEVSRISKYWPIMATLGNHETFRPKSQYLFENSFEIGNISATNGNWQRTQGYRFTNRSTFLFFDPWLQIYKVGSQQQYQVMKNKVIDEMHKANENYPEEYFIMASHYPVMCSQVDPHCRDALANMPDLYQYLSTQFDGKGMVDLYIGSHMHQYQRIWPFVNNQFVNQSSPFKRGRLVNFVEAVAGVNYWEVEPYYQPQYFSAYATHNITGMGILTISGSSVSKETPLNLRYKHIITPKTYEVVDEFEITNEYPSVKEESTSIHLVSG